MQEMFKRLPGGRDLLPPGLSITPTCACDAALALIALGFFDRVRNQTGRAILSGIELRLAIGFQETRLDFRQSAQSS
jgi:hypothetical protein